MFNDGMRNAVAGTALHSKHYQLVHGCVCACFRVVACSKKVVISLNVAGSFRPVVGKEGLPFHTSLQNSSM